MFSVFILNVFLPNVFRLNIFMILSLRFVESPKALCLLPLSQRNPISTSANFACILYEFGILTSAIFACILCEFGDINLHDFACILCEFGDINLYDFYLYPPRIWGYQPLRFLLVSSADLRISTSVNSALYPL